MSVLIPGPSDSLHVRLFSAGYVELRKWWVHTDRIRTMWRLCRAETEGAALLLDSRSFAFPAGRLALVPPGLDFKAHLEHPVKKLYIHFELIGWAPAAVGELFTEPVTLGRDQLRDRLADELREELCSSNRLGPPLSCRVKSLVHLSLASLETALPEEKVALLRRVANGQEDLLEVFRYIDQHLPERLDNSRLAEVAHASESCFIRRFREAIGQTPGRYIRDRRVARASKLLISTDCSIDEIAESCGFGNRYYFSRVFSKRVGRPPASYRKERAISIGGGGEGQ
jgi:AraC-like DNA-binding protein